jgi:ATP-dependent helicase/nuclease subunit A
MIGTLSDGQARERAATATDRNVVVTAGAGTGKTTLLIDRLLHLLLHRPDPLTTGEIVALTFTNKAADEIKLRLRGRLAELPSHDRAVKALGELETSQIGTIHSFAAHLLRLFPVESGVDPAFKQDEGGQFKDYFGREWALWLDEELGPQGGHHAAWKAALEVVTLEDLRELARTLVGELIPLEGWLAEREAIPPPVRDWLAGLARHAHTLRDGQAKANTLERMLEDAASYLRQIVDRGWGPAPAGLDREVPPITRSWSRDQYQAAKGAIRAAQAVANIRTDRLMPIVRVLLPFARACRQRFVRTGYVSFDGLIARARDLVRDHPAIRRELKAKFRSILVDEFQDTDPVQYEMILYLAEAAGHEHPDWRRVRLEPGKLFIVGDPKQSIYAFRRADMEAYDAVVADRVLGQSPPGEAHTLRSNFRSHSGLLGPINAFFGRIFPDEPIKGLQPRYEALLPPDADAPRLAGEDVEIRLVQPDDAEADADTVGRVEAEELARSLREEMIGREEILVAGVRVKIEPGHVAILFRTLTDMRDYMEALRRYDIPFLTEGEKHFYERQEIIDAVNLLRAVVDAHDRLALVGVLRSSVGALPDKDLEALSRGGLLDYRVAGAPHGMDAEVAAAYASAAPVYGMLRELARTVPHLPLPDAMDAVLAGSALLELAAASIDGEQAVANVLKLRDLTVALARRPDMTLSGLAAELTRRLTDLPEETESSLAEDFEVQAQSGFVRLLSIHKAKGLEFPVVVLAGLQRGTNRHASRVMVQHDWSTGVVGLRVGDLQTLDGVYVGDKVAARQRAEQSRILYVAMTRAKRRLILSAGLPKQEAGDSFLSMVADGLGLEIEALKSASTIPTAGGDIRVRVLSGKAVPLRLGGRVGSEWREVDEDVAAMDRRWKERQRRWADLRQRPEFLTPSLLKAQAHEAEFSGKRTRPGTASETARMIGVLAHRILEEWDFADDPRTFDDAIERICHRLDGHDSQEITATLKDMFATLVASPSYGVLQSACVLGKEVPFSIPWADETPSDSQAAIGIAAQAGGSTASRSAQLTLFGEPTGQPTGAEQWGDHPEASEPDQVERVMEGVIDLIYRLDGQVWVVDYKTDRVEEADMEARLEEYRFQAHVYKEAVKRCLGLDRVRVQFVFLRSGQAVEPCEEGI